MRVANYLGIAVRVEDPTISVARGCLARICAEVDLKMPHVPMVYTRGHKQNAKYDGLHMIFFKCG